MTQRPTPDQRRAIEAEPGPTLVVAGPGAGKTFCLIGRVGHLLAVHRVAPERILAVTFTNKAAGEIAHRLAGECGGLGSCVTRGTLHAFCLGLLREFPEAAGLREGFGVADEEYQLALLRGLRVPEKRARQLVTIFGHARAVAGAGAALDRRDEGVYAAYREVLRRKNLVDFDDLILHTDELLRAHPEIRAQVAGRWDAILVDEFQDLTPTQYAILTRLVESHRHVFAVGDDEQSIYGFAGADPHVLDRFRQDFAIAEPIILETNHRNSRIVFETARRLLHANPRLFDKRLVASRASRFPVRALRFRIEEEEFDWLIADLMMERSAEGLPWGAYAVLYRRHQVGERLEPALLRAGIPVLTSRGRALADDPIAGPVFAAFRAIRDPRDRVPWELLAKRFLSQDLREILRARYPDLPLSKALRLHGWAPNTPEAEAKPVRRLYYHLTNLPALARAAGTLGALVDALLEQRPSDRRTRLEEQADGLTDPETRPAVRDLAAELERVRDDGHRIHVLPAAGLEIATAGMLRAAGLGHLVAAEDSRPEPDDLMLDLPGTPSAAWRLFKALQLLVGQGRGLQLDDCVTFDLETTGTDVERCGILEIGAVRIRGGNVVETFHTLVDPGMPIPAEATVVHGYTDADVAGAPSFATAWSRFREFVRNDLLVAHNARQFDMPVLIRHVQAAGAEARGLAFFDTFPLARSVSRASARLSSLAERYGVALAEAHHALDDAFALAGVLRGLLADRAGFHRKTCFTAGLDWLGLALVLERGERSAEEQLLGEIARTYTLGRYSDCLELYEAARQAAARTDAPPVEELIERLGGRTLMNRIRARRTAADRYPTSVARLRRLLEGCESLPVSEGINQVLDLVALARRDGSETQASAVSLLTLHATKGLEFSRVYIVGVEDYEIPGFHAMQGRRDEFPEARRLLYVGMTRARDRLVLTSAVERAGKGSGGTMLLDEMGLDLEPVEPLVRRPAPSPALG